ncbi:MAG TPA: hypothetical protein VIQ52_08730 [Arthrobacter sp.]
MNSIVPAGAVSAAAVPVAVLADDATAVLVETVAPPLVEAVPILEPVVQPVSELVTGTLPLPVTLPVLTDTGSVLPDTAGVLSGADSTVPPAVSGAPTDIGEEQSLGGASADVQYSGTHPAALAGTSASPAASAVAHRSATPESPLTGQLSPFPVPAGPSSGAGSGASTSGPAGPAAWLHDFDLDLPLPGSFAVAGASEHSPSPVSFDPGSSPD